MTLVVSTHIGAAPSPTPIPVPGATTIAPRPLPTQTPVNNRLTFSWLGPHTGYPPFTFQYPAEYGSPGMDIGAIMFDGTSIGRPSLSIFLHPSNATTARDAATELHLQILPRTRQIAGYAAIEIADVDMPKAWLFLTEPYRMNELLPELYRVDETHDDLIRWAITLPDDEVILSSFVLVK
jgi:hypothetical protein